MKEFDNELFEKVIMTAAKKKGIPQKQNKISDALGISSSTLNKWIKGNTKPNAEDLLNISDTLNVSVDALLGVKITADESNSSRRDAIILALELHDRFGATLCVNGYSDATTQVMLDIGEDPIVNEYFKDYIAIFKTDLSNDLKENIFRSMLEDSKYDKLFGSEEPLAFE